ncbi:hypothetical protein Vadar_001661 [Vaccinium darrowii]|uniref:Uncharacterized protein n=1 Tax=Vaccinium darrowii TaxID=229202 RepID=A0ACB7Z8V5_9ERIC|nr:hypothetical protein Vadar_001661 [Vaccinium darrowii]
MLLELELTVKQILHCVGAFNVDRFVMDSTKLLLCRYGTEVIVVSDCKLVDGEAFDNMIYLSPASNKIYAIVEEIRSSIALSVGSSSGVTFGSSSGDLEDVDDEEPLDDFCHYIKTRYLTSGWVNLTHCVGQVFRAKIANPGSILKLEVDSETKDFSRLFVSFNACIKGFNKCQPFLCLNGAHLRGRFKGTLLPATEKDTYQVKDAKLKKKIDKGGGAWRVHKSTTGAYEVKSMLAVLGDLNQGTCSCRDWQYNGFVCAHVATVLLKTRREEESMAAYIVPFYHVEDYQLTYEDNIFPILVMDIPDFTQGIAWEIKPPRNRRQPGRPSLKRIRSKSEEYTTKPRKCSSYHQVCRHNRRTCTESTKD